MTTPLTTRRRLGLAAALGALALAAPADASTLLSGSTVKRTTDAVDLSLWSSDDESGDRSGAASATPTASCPEAPLSQRFSAWSDPAEYKLAAGGDFEDGGAGWLLTGGAAVVDGGNTLGTGGHAVALPGGASVTSPPVCIAPGSPVARAFALGTGAGLQVELLDEAGQAKPAGRLPAAGAWDATRRFSLSEGWFLRANRSGVAWMRVRMTAEAGSSWLVDDVYVDPRSFG